MLVLGMHRSGTSAVARALAALGLDGGSDPLMGATADNPTGHFEVGRLNGLDDEVLDAVGGRWSAPPPAGPDEIAHLADTDLGVRARALIAEVFPSPGWQWKDPRVALLLPFWRRILAPEPVAVVVVRHPVEVARSLEARDGMALDYGLALWERYTRTLLRDLEGMTAHVVDYGDAVADPDAAAAGLAGFLAAAGVPAGAGDGAEARGALEARHRHQAASPGDDDRLSDEQRALHRRVSGLSGPHVGFPALALGAETPGLQTAFTEHKRLSRFEEEVDALGVELRRREEEIADLRAEIDRRSAQAGALAEQAMGLQRERDALEARIAQLEGLWPVRLGRRLRRFGPGDQS